jgi:hypothetical protein
MTSVTVALAFLVTCSLIPICLGIGRDEQGGKYYTHLRNSHMSSDISRDHMQ